MSAAACVPAAGSASSGHHRGPPNAGARSTKAPNPPHVHDLAHRTFPFAAACSLLLGIAVAQESTPDRAIPPGFDRQDQLRGSITPEREWWDLRHYDLALRVFPEQKSIEGHNAITFAVLAAGDRLQVDLQPPLSVTKVVHAERELEFERECNVYWVTFPEPLQAGDEHTVTVHYGGRPRQSTRPPWSGGFSWRKDEHGNDFIATTCQGIATACGRWAGR